MAVGWVALIVALGAALTSASQQCFEHTLYNVTIAENAIGRTVVQVVGTDKMGLLVSPSVAKVKFKVTGGDETGFFHASARCVGDFCFAVLRTRSSVQDVLNRERQDRYRLTVQGVVKGRDGSRHACHTAVAVTITDDNDLSPLFHPTSYRVEVGEDTPVYTTVVTVTASDADVGRNGEVLYRLAAGSGPAFCVQPASGAVILMRRLHHRDRDNYLLTVTATDRGAPPRTSTATLTVYVRRVNMHAPRIAVQSLPAVVEHGAIGTVYAILYIDDRDVGDDGRIAHVQIVDGDPLRFFKVFGSGSEYRVEVVKAIDREAHPDGFNLTIRAVDRGQPQSRSTTRQLLVVMRDTNDQAPRFERASYAVRVSECVPVGTPLTFIRALDADSGQNAEVTYTLTDGGRRLRLHPVTGLLSVAAPLDADGVAAVLRATAVAEDRGNSGVRRSATTSVEVTVSDCNDNTPAFAETRRQVALREGQAAGTVVARVAATDGDSGDNGYVSYSLMNELPSFLVDASTGEVRTRVVLDFESMRHQFVLRVRASDWGSPYRREAETTLTMHLIDVNDNRPRFTTLNCTVQLPLDAAVGSRLVTVAAIDFDATDQVSYAIVAGAGDDCFQVDSASGDIVSNCDLRGRRAGSVVTLVVTASDGPHESDPMSVTLTFTSTGELGSHCKESGAAEELARLSRAAERANMPRRVPTLAPPPSNSHAPRFDGSAPQRVSVAEDVAVGTELLRFTATDADYGYEGLLQYVIADGNDGGAFRVDTATGALIVLSGLDRERRAHYPLVVVVSDSGRVPRSASTTVHIAVQDINDNAPAFERARYSVSVAESVRVNTTLLRLAASDADAGVNADITFSIVPTDDRFSVDPRSGVVIVARPLDRERHAHHRVVVMATDGCRRRPLSASAVIEVEVTDVNDNAPAFQPPAVHVRVREDAPVGSIVAVVTAADPDQGSSGVVRYQLQGRGADHFEMDRLTGAVRIAAPLDFETRSLYNLTARAKDRGEPSLATRAHVVIEVVDVDENLHAPLFSDFVVEAEIAEDRPRRSEVMTLTARDDDVNNPATVPADYAVTYSIRGGTGIGRFTIDNNGVLRTVVTLDHETAHSYWLCVHAHDSAVVPRSSYVHVLVRVLDTNDNVPQTPLPAYFPRVAEGSAPGTPILRLEAVDRDEGDNARVTFTITGGNPQKFFLLHHGTGLLSTTNRVLDREKQEEHVLEVTVEDHGEPSLSSTTRVVVNVTDVNDQRPVFTEAVYRVVVGERGAGARWRPVYRVTAADSDRGPNADVHYRVMNNAGSTRFTIDPRTGVISTKKALVHGNTYDLKVSADDSGEPPLSQMVHVFMTVVPLPAAPSPHAPVFDSVRAHARVMENDRVGHKVQLLRAHDDDGDQLWHSITAGNVDETFAVDPETGSMILARRVDWETLAEYNLTVQVTDGFHIASTWVYVTVLDNNEHSPKFSRQKYELTIDESTAPGTSILTLRATDRDQQRRLFYTIHRSTDLATRGLFHVNSEIDSDGNWTGELTTAGRVDYEALSRHELTVMVRDQATPTRRSLARVVIYIRDANDHAPVFLQAAYTARVGRSAPAGTALTQVVAVDRDCGDNARLQYSIIAGNIEDRFWMDASLGLIHLARPLPLDSPAFYELTVRAVDGGRVALSGTATVGVTVTEALDAPPRFTAPEYTAEVHEGRPAGTFVIAVSANAHSSVVYALVGGDGAFVLNPHSGALSTARELDYETRKFYAVTVRATNMAGVAVETPVDIYVGDVNDNAPAFITDTYAGVIGEKSPADSVVLADGLPVAPLVVGARDADSGRNAMLRYALVEPGAVFTVDPATGAVRTRITLDREAVSVYHFSVRVHDLGEPHQVAARDALITVRVADSNDSPPRFSHDFYAAKLATPTFVGVAVLKVAATDPDVNSDLRYSLGHGDDGAHFRIEPTSGVIRVARPRDVTGSFELEVIVSDGTLRSVSLVRIDTQPITASGLRFTDQLHLVEVEENVPGAKQLVVLGLTGQRMNEELVFSIISYQADDDHEDGEDGDDDAPMFSIGRTSGVVTTTGLTFDREATPSYKLAVQVTDSRSPPRMARCFVVVAVTDDNDNAPVFIGQPYYVFVAVGAEKGKVIKKVVAVDADSGENASVRYRLLESQQLFRVREKSGELILRQNVPPGDENRKYKLMVEAFDSGAPTRSTRVEVVVVVMSQVAPVFTQASYAVTIAESTPLHTAVAYVEAHSTDGSKLIYSISGGNLYDEFGVDFSTGSITVVDELDYETVQTYNLTVRATDVMTGSYSEVIVRVQLEDVNDNWPSFTTHLYTAAVSESVAVGTTVARVTATDSDSGVNARISYRLATAAGDDAQNYVSVSATSGAIVLRRRLDREEAASLAVLVAATDGGIPALSATATVRLLVVNVNDNMPVFSADEYHADIAVGAKRGQFVTVVMATDDDGDVLTYRIVDGNRRGTFVMDERTGVMNLTPRRAPHLEGLYRLNVSVSDGAFAASVVVRIHVRGTNAHAPVFAHDAYEVDVGENLERDTPVANLSAVDRDSGRYGRLEYAIDGTQWDDLFHINPHTGVVYTREPLDREAASLYILSVVVRDGGGRATYTTLRVNVADAADHTPRFRVDEYKANVYASVSSGSSILQVAAYDADLGSNSDVHYSIYDGDGTHVSDWFRMDERSGVLSVRQSLHGKDNELFQFFVRAMDRGVPPASSDVAVEVYVMSESAVAPTFPRRAYAYFVSEDRPAGTQVACVRASTNHSLIYHLASTGAADVFTVGADSGCISLRAPLDREQLSKYELSVVASTRTSPPLVAHVGVTVTVMDVNDNAPRFDGAWHAGSVVENAPAGTRVVRVRARDPDAGVSGQVTYRLTSAANVFAVDRRSGWLTTLVSLDRELTGAYNVSVEATDGGDPPLSGSTTVTVEVTDDNDNPPLFTRTTYRGAVREDATRGTVILSVSTTDGDLPGGPDVAYHITAGDERRRFTVDERGEVTLRRPVDREEVASYRLEVTATDGAYVTTTTVNVEILDANDNSPVCEQPLYQTVVAENLPVGSFITQLLATDADQKGTPNSRIEYLLEGDTDAIFKIHRRTGVISTARALDRETTAEYELSAVARDAGGRACRTTVYVSLSDVNDNAPIFSSTHYEVMIPEDAHVNTLLTRMSANDRDRGVNRKVRYAMKSSHDPFKIDAVSGIVSLTKELDRERQAQFNLTIYAYDQGTPRMTSTAYLVVLLLDINDNPPEFERALYRVTVSEGAGVGDSLARVYAASRDTGVNAQITYAITTGNEQGCFSVTPKSGVLSLARPLDFETTPQYIMTVEARDGGTPSLRNTAIVKVNVTDANDNTPQFAHATYTAELSEAAQIHDTFLQVKATDRDGPQNAVLTYRITSGDPRRQFTVSSNTGHISVAAPLDRELIEHYKLTIEARDSGTPSLSSATSVEIVVLDTNDSPPQFSEKSYSVIVQEDRPVQHSLLQLTVTDDDSDPNGSPFTFDIVSGDADAAFEVTGHGVVTLVGVLDRGVRDRYALVVRVHDNGVPPLSATVTVSVRVVEESAYPPVVTPLAVVVAAYDGEFAGGLVGRVSATDRDAYDTLTFTLATPSDLFEVHIDDGSVYASRGLDAGQYSVAVVVFDGKFRSVGDVSLRVVAITDDLAANAVVVRFATLPPEEFIDRHRHRFITALESILSIHPEDAHILGVQPAAADRRHRRATAREDDLDVLIAVRHSPDGATYGGDTLRRHLSDAAPQLGRKTGAKVMKVFNDICGSATCGKGACVTEVTFSDGDVVTVTTQHDSFVSPRFTLLTVCQCEAGYTGALCADKMDVCSPNPCPAYRHICRADGREFTCTCLPGYSGYFCETNEHDRDVNCIDMACRKGKPLTFSTFSYVAWQLTIPMVRRVSFTFYIKTVQRTARLMHSTGGADYSILELDNGLIQYRFDCGSGEGRTRVSEVTVSDGRWHAVTVERRGRRSKVIIDGEYVASGEAPGTNSELNLDGFVFFGAEVTRLADGHEDVTLGFTGCLRDIKVDGVALPLVGSNEVAVFKNSRDIEFHCRGEYIEGVCSSSPCLNGGSCVSVNPNSFVCRCRGRFIGVTCDTDTDPCASNPCLHQGTCENMGSQFRCRCMGELKGARCEVNFYCYPNPCKHGGTCRDGRRGPICSCSGFTGELCERDIDECASAPCQNGGTCTNLFGGFRCNCTPDIGGATCQTVLLTSITSTGGSFNLDELFGIAGVVGGILLIAVIFVAAMRYRWRRRHRRATREQTRAGESASYLYNCEELKERNRHGMPLEPLLEGASEPAMSEVRRPTPPPPPVPTRPASYTPSAGGSMNTLDNGLDDLETAPMLHHPIHIPEFLRNLEVNKTVDPPPTGAGAGVSTQRPAPPPRCYDTPATRCASTPRNFREGVRKAEGGRAEGGTAGSRGCSLASLPISEEGESHAEAIERRRPDYAWDTSDWYPDGATAAVPLRELPDVASDESDLEAAPDDGDEYMEPDSEYVGDSEYVETENEADESYDVDFINSAQFQEMLARQADLVYEVNDDADDASEPHIDYNLHPDDYLPPYQLDDTSLHDTDASGVAPPRHDVWAAGGSDDGDGAAEESVYVGGLGSDCGGLVDESDYGGATSDYGGATSDYGAVTSGYGDLPSDFGAVPSDMDDGGGGGDASSYGGGVEDGADSDYGQVYARNAPLAGRGEGVGYTSTNGSAVDMSCLCEIEDSEMNSDGGGQSDQQDDDEGDVHRPLLEGGRPHPGALPTPQEGTEGRGTESLSPTHTQV